MLRDNNRGDEFDRSALHTFMEILQWNPFVELIHANKIFILIDK
jgi:hypothetical protein